ncbi:hypothetical protein [Agrobacterium fabrum]|uniref:hypothetical protein n=1 Tax=Agrobacterium fabrum TaxID=1176649 RepID=UPI003B9FE6C6
MKRTGDQSNTSDLVLHRTKIITCIWGVCVICLVLWRVGKHGESLDLNEWGDFAAGAFSPVAFVWFIAAVIMQSFELREQRAELKLTRNEFELNRRVLEAQSREAGRQADLLEAQSDVLKSTWKKAENDSNFEESIAYAASRLRAYPHAWSFDYIFDGRIEHLTGRSPYHIPSDTYRDQTDEAVIITTAKYIRGGSRTIRSTYEGVTLVPKYPTDLSKIYEAVETATIRILPMPIGYHMRLQGTELEDLFEHMDKLEKLIQWPEGFKRFDMFTNPIYIDYRNTLRRLNDTINRMK